ncbi:hypothetical protein C7U92_08445 [Bradyrhizobium sp. WBOS7]|uniref:Uncharacterized protein n=1 Tax=Bradyrhizobium betae TaxID=244734 RepID=A0AAE9SU25_9BRAD|nr:MULTISPECIES: hypothetical protein [Bradyrhizobium]MDD1570143.1 hypothetical protein [Bradyrhizobium sp. WBOS1]UUO36710.1 hypothetical protein DCK84_20500 [Bradyrhizobium sp. WBOS01]MDD1525880.1 hypothetical protein [Bradyrhizobium sp. WBOS2]MDD1576763.1 hypothetical protein [Bradyrhizobium sp. WBOS7]MDD1599075.1 hypothetical protein [Bradyrhizobium sp. WBOS16]
MSPTPILERIRSLFTADTSEPLDSIKNAFVQGALKQPVRPMSDQELARAIREFRSAPVSDWTLAKLSRRFVEASCPHDD